MVMMPTTVGFMRAYPEIILDLDFSDRLLDVIEEGFNAVVRFAEVDDWRLMTRALGTYRRHLVAAPAYLAPKGVPLIPDDLKLMPVCTTSFRPAESSSDGRSGPSMPASRPNCPGQPWQVQLSH
jgi:DNA-binding transcriptional LysR family regulator